MTRTAKSLVGIGVAVLMIVAGVYMWFGENSIVLALIGLLVLPFASGVLLSTQSRAQVRAPHPVVYVCVAFALALHLYENLPRGSTGFAVWALVPYVLVIVVSCFARTRIPVIAGAVLALVADAWTYYTVANSTSSTAGLAFLWMPLWNTIIIVPGATFLAWLAMRKGPSSSSAAL